VNFAGPSVRVAGGGADGGGGAEKDGPRLGPAGFGGVFPAVAGETKVSTILFRRFASADLNFLRRPCKWVQW